MVLIGKDVILVGLLPSIEEEISFPGGEIAIRFFGTDVFGNKACDTEKLDRS